MKLLDSGAINKNTAINTFLQTITLKSETLELFQWQRKVP